MSAIKHQPATPLPWDVDDEAQICALNRAMFSPSKPLLPAGVADWDAAYIVHSANAYPELVAALTDLVKRCDGPEGVRADGSNIQTISASALLQKLGEL